MRPSFLLALGLGALGLAACATGSAIEDGDDDVVTPDDDSDGGSSGNTSSGNTSSGGASSSGGGASSSSGGGASSSGGGASSSSSGGASSSSGGADACLAALEDTLIDFEDWSSTTPAGPNNWYAQALDGFVGDESWPYNPWRIANVDTTVVGTACASGRCTGTELTQNYAQCQRGETGTPPFDLSACAGRDDVYLVFDHAFQFQQSGSFRDGGLVEMSASALAPGSASWTQLDTAAMPGLINIRGTLSGYSCNSPDGFYVHGKSVTGQEWTSGCGCA